MKAYSVKLLVVFKMLLQFESCFCFILLRYDIIICWPVMLSSTGPSVYQKANEFLLSFTDRFLAEQNLSPEAPLRSIMFYLRYKPLCASMLLQIQVFFVVVVAIVLSHHPSELLAMILHQLHRGAS